MTFFSNNDENENPDREKHHSCVCMCHRVFAVPGGLKSIINTLRGAGHQAYLVGGAVRDLLLGRKPKDWDVTTDAEPERIQTLFEHTVPLGAAFGIITVIMDDGAYEVATFREEREYAYADGRHPDEVRYATEPGLDVIRRDFTVNALLYDPVASLVIDYTGGMDDMHRGILRAIGDPERRFAEDHLRMLRAVRFAARLGYRMDSATFNAIRQHACDVAKVSMERIRDELEKMLLHSSRRYAFELLAETGLLAVVMPEIDALRGCEQPPVFHPEGDVFQHTMLMLEHIAWPSPPLAWSVLLHDVGKPPARTVKDDGVAHFYGHEAIGADMAGDILRKLRLPNAVIESVVPAVRNHMKFAHVDKMKPATWRRMIADKNFPVELELHRIDCISCHGLMGNYYLMLDRLRLLELEGQAAALPPPLLTGKDMIALGMKPGVKMGVMLREIADLQLNGVLKDRESAIEYVQQRNALTDMRR